MANLPFKITDSAHLSLCSPQQFRCSSSEMLIGLLIGGYLLAVPSLELLETSGSLQ